MASGCFVESVYTRELWQNSLKSTRSLVCASDSDAVQSFNSGCIGLFDRRGERVENWDATVRFWRPRRPPPAARRTTRTGSILKGVGDPFLWAVAVAADIRRCNFLLLQAVSMARGPIPKKKLCNENCNALQKVILKKSWNLLVDTFLLKWDFRYKSRSNFC